MLEYALYNNAGFCVISGDIGAGKTTLLRKLLDIMEENITVGMITNTHKSFGDLLDWVLSAYNIHKSGLNKVEMHQAFLDFLLAQYAKKKTTLLIVDEAQNMSVETLEELRMLSNINSGKDQLLQIILAGQPELKDTLRRPELKQFVQRIAVDYHLGALSIEETFGYIRHRLATAGATRDLFTPLACQRIHEYSGGIPRLINLLCDTALVYGFADQAKLISESLVDEMVREHMADSLVPIRRTGRTGSENTPPVMAGGGRSEQSAVPPASQLKPVSAEPKKKAAKPTAEKKTVTNTRPTVVPQSQSRGSGQQTRLAVDDIPELHQQDDVFEVKARATRPKPITEQSPAPRNSHGKMLLDFEAAAATSAGVGKAESDKTPVAAQLKAEANTPPRRENRIEVLSVADEPQTSWFDKWTLITLLVLVIVVTLLVSRGVGDDEDVLPEAEVSPAAVPVSVVDEELSSQDAAAEVERLEQERVAEEARRAQLETEARELQQQREAAEAEAKAKAKAKAKLEQAEKARQQQAAATKKAEQARLAEKTKAAVAKARAAELAAREKAEQEAARQLEAAAEAARQTSLSQDIKAAIEEEARQARELERQWQETQKQVQSQDEAAPASAAASTPEAKSESGLQTYSTANPVKAAAPSDPEVEFTTDPCQGPSAKFLSTCR